MNLTYMINVMQAFNEGEPIEELDAASNTWHKCKYPNWNWEYYQYRIAESVETSPLSADKVMPNHLYELRNGLKALIYRIYLDPQSNTGEQIIHGCIYFSDGSVEVSYWDKEGKNNDYNFNIMKELHDV